MKSLALSMPLSQDLRFCLRIRDGLLLVCQLDLQLLQLSRSFSKGDRKPFDGSSQGLEFIRIPDRSQLSPVSQMPLKMGDFIGRHPESPFIFLCLPSPTGLIHIVAHLDVLKLLLKVRDFLRPLPVAVGPNQEPG